MKVRYTRRAYRDLVAILDYIDERSPQGGRNVKRAVQNSIDLIGEHPKAGRMLGEHEIRVIPVNRYPYLIYWQTVADEVWLVHIRHASRRPWIGDP